MWGSDKKFPNPFRRFSAASNSSNSPASSKKSSKTSTSSSSSILSSSSHFRRCSAPAIDRRLRQNPRDTIILPDQVNQATKEFLEKSKNSRKKSKTNNKSSNSKSNDELVTIYSGESYKSRTPARVAAGFICGSDENTVISTKNYHEDKEQQPEIIPRSQSYANTALAIQARNAINEPNSVIPTHQGASMPLSMSTPEELCGHNLVCQTDSGHSSIGITTNPINNPNLFS